MQGEGEAGRMSLRQGLKAVLAIGQELNRLSVCTRHQRCQFVGSMPACWQRTLGTALLIVAYLIAYPIVFQ